jgi:hypothetical protein
LTSARSGVRSPVDPIGAPLEQRFAGIFERLEAPHRGRDGNADPVALWLDLEPGVCPRLIRRRLNHVLAKIADREPDLRLAA